MYLLIIFTEQSSTFRNRRDNLDKLVNTIHFSLGTGTIASESPHIWSKNNAD